MLESAEVGLWHTHKCTHVCIHTYARARMSLYQLKMCEFSLTLTHARTHTHTHTHTHIDAHTHALAAA